MHRLCRCVICYVPYVLGLATVCVCVCGLVLHCCMEVFYILILQTRSLITAFTEEVLFYVEFVCLSQTADSWII